MQVAHRSYVVDMLDGEALRSVREQESSIEDVEWSWNEAISGGRFSSWMVGILGLFNG